MRLDPHSRDHEVSHETWITPVTARLVATSRVNFSESNQAWEGVGWEETEQCTIHTIVLILHIANEVLL